VSPESQTESIAEAQFHPRHRADFGKLTVAETEKMGPRRSSSRA
jgi:hypothetical protein